MNFLIVGLGNPGAEYAATRHNLGWLILNEIQKTHGLSDFKLDKKLRAEIASGIIAGQKVLLVKPQTFMNLSGESVRAVLDFYKLSPANVLAIYDELALPFGQLRLRADGGSGGHNGVKSLIQHMGTQNFARVRVGIANEFTAQTPADKFVLAPFSATEKAELPKVATRAAEAVTAILADGLDAAGNKFNAVIEK